MPKKQKTTQDPERLPELLCFVAFLVVRFLVWVLQDSLIRWQLPKSSRNIKTKRPKDPKKQLTKKQNSSGILSGSLLFCFLVSGWGFEAARTQTSKDTYISIQFRHSLRIFVVFVAFRFRLSGSGIAGGTGDLKGVMSHGDIYIDLCIYTYTYMLYRFLCLTLSIYIYIYIYLFICLFIYSLFT